MNNFLTYLFQSGCAFAALYAVYWAFLRQETTFRFNRFLLLIMPVIALGIPVMKFPSPWRTITAEISPPLSNETVALSSSEPIPIFQLLFFAGLAGLFVYFLFQWLRLNRWIRHYPVERHPQYRLVKVDKAISPFSFFQYIFFPNRKISDPHSSRIMDHECVHVREFHSIDRVFIDLLTMIMWWNPFVWPYRRSVKENHEFLADAGVIARGCDKAGYQMLILEQFVGAPVFASANHFRQSQIKRRITMLSKIKSNPAAKRKGLLLLPVMGLLLLAFAPPRVVTSQQEKVIKSPEVQKPSVAPKLEIAVPIPPSKTQPVRLDVSEPLSPITTLEKSIPVPVEPDVAVSPEVLKRLVIKPDGVAQEPSDVEPVGQVIVHPDSPFVKVRYVVTPSKKIVKDIMKEQDFVFETEKMKKKEQELLVIQMKQADKEKKFAHLKKELDRQMIELKALEQSVQSDEEKKKLEMKRIQINEQRVKLSKEAAALEESMAKLNVLKLKLSKEAQALKEKEKNKIKE